MNLIDKENRMLLAHQFVNNGLQAFFKVTTVFGAGNQGTDIKRINRCRFKYVRNFTINNHLGQPFSQCRFTDAGLANQQGIVLTSTTQYLGGALNLVSTANQGVYFALSCLLIQVGGIFCQRAGR